MAPQEDRPRYRRTKAAFDVVFLFGAFGATTLPGPAIVAGLEALDMSASAARNLLVRLASGNVLLAERAGQVTAYRCTEWIAHRFADVEGQAPPPEWAGEFGTVIYDVPESHRSERDRLRYSLEYLGYGFLRPGVALTTHLEHPGLPQFSAAARVFTGRLRPHDLADAREMAAGAWDLGSVDARLRQAADVMRRVSAAAPASGPEALRALNAGYVAFGDAVLSIPPLPPALVPAGWPLPEVMESKRLVDDTLLGPARAYLHALAATRRGAGLIEPTGP